MADVLEEEIRASEAKGSVVKDLFAGAVGGIAQVLIGTPLILNFAATLIHVKKCIEITNKIKANHSVRRLERRFCTTHPNVHRYRQGSAADYDTIQRRV